MTDEAPPDPASGPLADLTASERMAILAVDDRPENLRALEAVLAPLGYPVVTATSGEEALRLLLGREFALVLLDIRMPGLDGLETARLIKGRARTAELPIVFLTAAQDEVADMVLGYGLGAVDYVLKPFDPELLRSKVAVFAELEHSRRSLRQSEAFLLAAFAAAPIGKTVLDAERRIVRANPAFSRAVGRHPEELVGATIAELCHPDDRDALAQALGRVSVVPGADVELGIDVRLRAAEGREAWMAPTATAIDSDELAASLLLVQWVDIGARRRAEQARAELLLEQAARSYAESQAERLGKLYQLGEAALARTLPDTLDELAERVRDVFDAARAEIELEDRGEGPGIGRAGGPHEPWPAERVGARWLEAPLMADGVAIGALRVELGGGRAASPLERELLHEAAERFSLIVQRAELQQREHRIAVELQRGLMPAELPRLPGVEVAAHYEAAGVGAEVGGDWYDVFTFDDGRLGVVVGDVTGSGIHAASTMGQLRSVTRALALSASTPPTPAAVLTRLHRYYQTLDTEEMFTLLYLVLDPAQATITWANAGHPPPLLQSGGKVRPLHGSDTMMSFATVEYHDRTARLEPSDSLILYTDGLIERRGETIDAGIGRLARAVAAGPDSARELCDYIVGQRSEDSTPTQDDVTAVVVKLVRTGELARALPRDVHAPAHARRALEEAFAASVDEEVLGRAKLAVSELVTNAVRHGHGAIAIQGRLEGRTLSVAVSDEGSGFAYGPRDPGRGLGGGWGLSVVEAETSRWGHDAEASRVWFEIDLPDAGERAA